MFISDIKHGMKFGILFAITVIFGKIKFKKLIIFSSSFLKYGINEKKT